jgi:excisionase family DNA binding protein
VRFELDPDSRPTVSVDEAAIVLGISRASAYQAAKNGELPVLRFGRKMRVPTAALMRMLEVEATRG